MDLLKELKRMRYCLAPNTYRTIRGQILSGDVNGAKRGMERAKIRMEKEVEGPLALKGGMLYGKGSGD